MATSLIVPGCLVGMMALLANPPSPDPLRIETLQFDSARSHADFSVKVLWMIPVDGQFGEIRGDVAIDHFRSHARVDATIDVNGVSMRRNTYENWVKSVEFFDVAQYPSIRFHSDSFPLSRLLGGGLLPGALTMRGIERPVLFEVRPSTCERPAVDCAVEAKGTVRRSEFGMTTRRATLSDKVELSFSIRILASDEHPPETIKPTP